MYNNSSSSSVVKDCLDNIRPLCLLPIRSHVRNHILIVTSQINVGESGYQPTCRPETRIRTEPGELRYAEVKVTSRLLLCIANSL